MVLQWKIFMHCISRPPVHCLCNPQILVILKELKQNAILWFILWSEPKCRYMLFCDLRHLPATDDTEIHLPPCQICQSSVRPIRLCIHFVFTYLYTLYTPCIGVRPIRLAAGCHNPLWSSLIRHHRPTVGPTEGHFYDTNTMGGLPLSTFPLWSMDTIHTVDNT